MSTWSSKSARDITLDDYRAVLRDVPLAAFRSARAATPRAASSMAITPAPIQIFADGPGPCQPFPTSTLRLAAPSPKSKTQHGAHVAIVGSDIVDNLLGPGDPLGKEIRVDGAPYTVIGVGEARAKCLGQSMDNWVAIPLTAFLQHLWRPRYHGHLCRCRRRRRGHGLGLRRTAHHHAHAPPSCAECTKTLSPSIPARPSRICWARYSIVSAPWSPPSPAFRWSSAASSS